MATSTNQMESGLALSVSRLYDAVEAAGEGRQMPPEVRYQSDHAPLPHQNNNSSSPAVRLNSNASGSLRPSNANRMHHSSLPSIETGVATAASNARFSNNNTTSNSNNNNNNSNGS